MNHPPPQTTLFPYTTLFRSQSSIVIININTITCLLPNSTQPGSVVSGNVTTNGGTSINSVSVTYALLPILESIITHNNSCSADRKSTRLNSSHVEISYAVFC